MYIYIYRERESQMRDSRVGVLAPPPVVESTSSYLREVKVHLVSVEVGVVRGAAALVETERAAWHDDGPVAHDGLLVQ